MYLDSLIQLHYLRPELLAALATVTILVAVVAGVAGSVSPTRLSPPSSGALKTPTLSALKHSSGSRT